MAKYKRVEASKPTQARYKSFSDFMQDQELLPVGGNEGVKKRITLEQGNTRLTFVAKEFFLWHEDQVEKIVAAFKTLYRKGYPVPNAVWYVKTRDKIYLIMSDVTENDKFWIWGHNGHVVKSERDALRAMHLSEPELREIAMQIAKIVRRAIHDGYDIRFNTYHIRKHKRTGKVDITLLDIPPWCVDVHQLSQKVEKHAILFAEVLSKTLGGRPSVVQYLKSYLDQMRKK